jgi:peroxiredoxin
MIHRKMSLWVLGLTTLLLNFALAVQVGDSAPDFELVDTQGATHTLSQYQGQVVFLNFFGYS